MNRRIFLGNSVAATAAVTVGNSWAMESILDSRLLSPTDSSMKDGVIENEVFSNNWKIRSVKPGEFTVSGISNTGEWFEVPIVPSMPHEILLHHKQIEEPWKPFGMEKCFWVSGNDWVYLLEFSTENLSGEKRLIFEEMKGKVDIYFNGLKVASHSDQSQPLVVDVSGKLLPKNQLLLHFFKAAPNQKPGEKDQSKRAQVGNYLGPNPIIYTSGIVGHVVLEHTDGSLMNEIVTEFSLNESLTEGKVACKIFGKSRFSNVKIQLKLIAPNGKQAAEKALVVETENGIFKASPELTIANPELWWPRGYGEQKLYKAEISLIVNGTLHQKETRTLGFRKIEMPETLLHFVVNGKTVFLRGGNWVTPNLMSDVWDADKVGKLFDIAENANFNAFRIWGPVEAPNDQFYEMADKRGFLLWQDFTRMPFKTDENSLQICSEKSARFIKRLKHHPSVLLWCGINESAMWWHEDYNNDFTDHGPWPGLTASNVVEKVCKELDPDRYYIPSAPYGGVNANDPREGSTNGYTNMWFVPGYDYLNFASEDTRISCPTLQSMEKFMLPEEIIPKGYSTISLHGNRNPFPESWLPFTAAEGWKKTGPVEQFYDATDAASLVNRIGMAEGVYYRDVVERQRRGRPATENSERRCCGGYIVWKYNDSWPEIYSAKVDYFLEPFHVYYTLRAAYAPVILSFDFDTYLYLWAVNDSTKPVSGTVTIRLYHLEQCVFRKEILREVTLDPGKSKVVVRLDEAGIRAFRKEHILFAEWKDSDGKVIARTNALADIERRCIFPDAKLDVKVENNSLVITTDKFARNINLIGNADGDKSGWFFEDNYFDLLPGERKVVRILGKHTKGLITAKPWYSPHATTIDWQRA
jgi:hypothetical protein